MLDESRDFVRKLLQFFWKPTAGLLLSLDCRRRTKRKGRPRVIIRVAQGQTELDAEKLRNAAADAMLNECATDRRLVACLFSESSPLARAVKSRQRLNSSWPRESRGPSAAE